MTVLPDMAIGIRAAAWVVGALLAATFLSDSWAGRSGGRGGGRSAAAGASHYPGSYGHHSHHPHHGHGTAFFIGGTYWPYFPPPYPYYYPPGYSVPYQDPGTVYVERFDGTPTADTPGDIFCPSADAYYPDVTECPNGWQRVIGPAS